MPSLPFFVTEFETSAAWVTWLVTSFLVSSSVLTPILAGEHRDSRHLSGWRSGRRTRRPHLHARRPARRRPAVACYGPARGNGVLTRYLAPRAEAAYAAIRIVSGLLFSFHGV